MRERVLMPLVIVGSAIVIVLAVVLPVLILTSEKQYISHVEAEFRQACSAIAGNAAWNSRHWECLK